MLNVHVITCGIAPQVSNRLYRVMRAIATNRNTVAAPAVMSDAASATRGDGPGPGRSRRMRRTTKYARTAPSPAPAAAPAPTVRWNAGSSPCRTSP